MVNGVTKAGIPLLDVSLPIGISFYTFQALSYIIDLYRGEAVSYTHLDVYKRQASLPPRARRAA